MNAIPRMSSLVIAALLAGACEDPPPVIVPVVGPCESADSGMACLELGVGADATPIADESPIDLVHGPQGGWHVEVGVRLLHIDAEGTTLIYEARREEDDTVLSTVRYGITPRRLIESGPYLVRANDLVVFEITSPDAVLDQRVTFEARIEDENGIELASDVRTLLVVDEEA